MNRKWTIALTVVVVGVAGALAFAWQPAIAPVAPVASAMLDQGAVARGARIVALGDCMVCHTSKDGTPFAGGRALRTPFGTLYTTNITPHVDANGEGNGIGDWSLAAFTRAVRQGVARDGHLLYPAFPYIHYTKMTDADIADAYAFLMSREAVDAKPPANDLPLPLRFRPLLAGWNLLYLRSGAQADDASQDATWNRGRYLVNGLGHCASCHSSLNPIGGEGSPAFGGGNVDGWDAPALTTLLDRPTPWNQQQLALYLRHGYSPEHGAAGGPMAPVTHSLASVPQEDAQAMARYLMTLQTAAPPKPGAPALQADSGQLKLGATLFAGACATCHGAAPAGGLPSARSPLALATAVAGERPDNLIQVLLEGMPLETGRSTGQASRYMPPFASALTDAQIAALAAYIRVDIAKRPVWPDVEKRAAALRKAAM
ncbi:c-type cytochrome [Janthinobacterium aquaticum]|uniref:c-type cytochrome n=1 Tax=Janthinobacterium sp. FT58W TaxID=2654254 RepID=UPI001265252D|nr:c-type cytochrome [Janthinobacterium sp. FT58W]KAB8044979.1 c-type cytochrome [Janthinobacterium sp. FT58W]